MRQLRHLLRLHHGGVSARGVGRRLGVARSTIQDDLKTGGGGRINLAAAPRLVIEVAFAEEELADLVWVSRSRTERASHFQRVRILFTYRQTPLLYATGRAISVTHQAVEPSPVLPVRKFTRPASRNPSDRCEFKEAVL